MGNKASVRNGTIEPMGPSPFRKKKPPPLVAGFFHVRKYWLGRAEKQKVGFFRPREVWVWRGQCYPVASPEAAFKTIRIDLAIGSFMDLTNGMVFQYLDPTASDNWVV